MLVQGLETPTEAAPENNEPATKAEGKAKAKKTKAEKPKKASALDAAVKVLTEMGKPMNTKEMIDAMTATGLWTSPNGGPRMPPFIPQCCARSTPKERNLASRKPIADNLRWPRPRP